jgi:ABC-2 type transport system permease protein
MKNLLKSRIRQLKNTIRASGKRQYILFFLLGSGLIGVMGFFSTKIFGYLYHQEEFPDFFKLFVSEKILTMVFLTMFMMLILSALIATLNIFFLSRDLHLLLSSPMRSRTIFAWKTVEVGISSALMAVFFSMPVLFSYSYYFAPGIWDIAAIILVFLLYIICGVLIGIIIGMIIPAFFSVKKLQPMLSLVAIIFISTIVIFLRLLRPERFGNPDIIDNLLEYMGGLNVKMFDYFPFAWISKALKYTAANDSLGYWKAVGAFLIIILLLAGFTWFLQKKYYLRLFDKLNKGSRAGYRSRWKKPLFLAWDYSTLWKKEIKTFIRTPAQWSQLLVIGAIIIVFILNLEGIPLPHPAIKNFIAYLNLGMAAFIVAGLNSRFTFTSIPMENPGIVHLLASPFKRKKIYRFKLMFFAVPQFIIGFMLFLTGDISLHLEPFSRTIGFFFLVPVLPFLTVLSIFFSLKIEEFAPLAPEHLITSKSGISYMLWSLIYIVMGMIYMIRPVYLYYYNKFFKRAIPTFEISLWFAGFLFLNLLLIVIIYRKSLSLWIKREFSAS